MQGLNNIHPRLQNFVLKKVVFSESSFEQKSKSDLDSLIRRQFGKINAVTEKYEQIASSKLGHLTSEQLLSLYGESDCLVCMVNQTSLFWMAMSPGVPHMGYTYLNL